ncbi:Hypothetical protein NGAL_HAMBI1145_53220 [Neorhizobium galegae bv. officinalis]|uniref:Uncharacterized protein n=1 Tax=Neorhizobium galegae bv. officinalis TaxID=323656 RepID=A0A0T7FZ77_NEOGA|nr:Hypothetical protein NGAL_HAMBI1145_53220 [Neorhizobium galegae bv. officinalis]
MPVTFTPFAAEISADELLTNTASFLSIPYQLITLKIMLASSICFRLSPSLNFASLLWPG